MTVSSFSHRVLVLALAACVAAACGEGRSQAPGEQGPRRILITNDNGIDDLATLALAWALAERAEVYLVAPASDRSGTSNFMPSVSRGSVTVERRDIGPGITAFAVDGYPGDCIVFALAGPMRDAPPDLVVSGINGGPNLVDDWLGSGTIGAARTAAYLGLPAVAVSGVEDDDPRAVDAVVDWVVRFLRPRRRQGGSVRHGGRGADLDDRGLAWSRDDRPGKRCRRCAAGKDRRRPGASWGV